MGGSWRITVKRVPDSKWDPRKGDHHTGWEVGPFEWEKLVFDTLGAPDWESYVDGENIHDFEERQKRRFQGTLAEKGFPFIARIWKIYRDATFQPDEIESLLNECERALDFAKDPQARSGLEKLILGCREALKTGSGISLLSD